MTAWYSSINSYVFGIKRMIWFCSLNDYLSNKIIKEINLIQMENGTSILIFYDLRNLQTQISQIYVIMHFSSFSLFSYRRLVSIVISTVIDIQKHQRRQDTVPKLFTKLVPKNSKRIAIYFEEETWTFQEVENLSNKIANFFRSEGYKRGDVVALFMENRPEYVCVWLGLSKLGVVTSLVNSNLVGDPLLHSIRTVNPKCIIFGSPLKEVIKNISNSISDTKLYQLSGRNEKSELLNGTESLNVKLEEESDRSPTKELEKGKISDKLLFIYTSGTTGLPKAAIISNGRFLLVNNCLAIMTKLKETDILYNSLPLYHSTGAMLALSHCLVTGGPIVIRKKFSASNFWKDCNRYNCTATLYIGEICRYLLAHHINENTPIHHPVTKFIGAGLRPAIWKQFVSKFNIKQVFEIYASTEGNVSMMNLDNTPGAVGYFPVWLNIIHTMSLIKCNMETAEPVRGSDGFYQVCQPGEPGLFIGKVSASNILGQFLGYVNKEASEKKLLRNVFKQGDVFFNSGDILVQDELGYFYFRDRTGDTFRWKGENVATSEVEAIISNILNLEDAVVYGVEIPGTEGRAGMAAVVDNGKTLDLKKFGQSLKNNLPSYSIPIFLRIIHSVELTGTFKLKKTTLRDEGFNLEKIQDKLYMFDIKNITYVELTRDLYDNIMTGKVRL